MFIVEYRTKSANRVYPSNFINVGAHKAQSKEAAAEYALHKLGNVEIVFVTIESYN